MHDESPGLLEDLNSLALAQREGVGDVGIMPFGGMLILGDREGLIRLGALLIRCAVESGSESRVKVRRTVKGFFAKSSHIRSVKVERRETLPRAILSKTQA